MRALESEVADAVWVAVEALLPSRADAHPLGCHSPPIPDRVCFMGILIGLVTGCSWVTAERLLGGQVSDTALRARRDEWVAAGVFDALAAEALEAYDRIVGLDLSDAAVDGSQHKAPCGGPGTGPNPTDRDKRGRKWSLLCDRAGIPVRWATDGANRHDRTLFSPTVVAVEDRGPLADAQTLHLDRGYDSATTRRACTDAGTDDVICARRRPHGAATHKTTTPSRPRWPVEHTNP